MRGTYIISGEYIDKKKLFKLTTDLKELATTYNELRTSQHVYGYTLGITEIDTLMPIEDILTTIDTLCTHTELDSKGVLEELIKQCSIPEIEIYENEFHDRAVIASVRNKAGNYSRYVIYDKVDRICKSCDEYTYELLETYRKNGFTKIEKVI